jgi:hypothetical protein
VTDDMWPFRRKSRGPSEEALAALRRAEAASAKMDEDEGLLDRIGERLRVQRVENHIGPAVADAFTRRRNP